jgi:TonB family protein
MLNVKSGLIVLAVSLLQSTSIAQTNNSQAASASQPVAYAMATTSDVDPIALYKSYDEAVNANRLTDAARFANDAWQAAEAKWGAGNPNTGALAYNAAWSAALIGKSADRVDAARRAIALITPTTAAYTAKDAQFLLAYGEFFATPEGDRAAAAPKLAAAASEVEATWGDFLIVNALVSSANVGATSGRSRATIETADRALATIERLTPNDTNSRVMALFARAKGRLLSGRARDEAVADLVQARVAYGPMKVVDDKTWGALAAWELAIRSVVRTAQINQTYTGTRISTATQRPVDMTPEQYKIVTANPFSPPKISGQCDGVTRNMRIGNDIAYPVGAANEFQVAGVIIRTDLNADGSTTNTRLLGAVPAGAFGENALRAVSTWKYSMPEGAPSVCRSDRDISVNFIIAN